MNKNHVVIVGGGISGLSTAFFLSQRALQEPLSLKITVLEASNRFGGVLQTLTQADHRLETGADAFYAGQKDAVDLCRELGLQEDVIEAAPCFRHFFYLKNKIPFSAPGLPDSFFAAARFLNDPRLSFFTKCRMFLEPLIPRRQAAEDESLASFVCRRLGQGFYEKAVRPLVQSVYMMDPGTLSLQAMFPRFWQAERTHGSLVGSFLSKPGKKKETDLAEFFTLKHGLEVLVQTLVRKLEKCELRRSAPVRQCVYDGGWTISLEGGASLRADSLFLAMNACDASKLLSASAPELSRELSTIRYDSIAAVNLIYRCEDVPARDWVPGFLVPQEDDRYPFSSLKWLGKTAGGKHLTLRAFLSETMMPGLFRESDETLQQKILAFLNDFLSIRAKPLFLRVDRYPSALPQYETGHLERVVRIEGKIRQYPGLYLAGNGFRGFGITDCIRQARIVTSNLKLPSL